MPTTYYLSPSGNDAAAGSQAAPWASLAKAQSVLANGDTLLMQGGFRGSLKLQSKTGITLAPYGQGVIINGTVELHECDNATLSHITIDATGAANGLLAVNNDRNSQHSGVVVDTVSVSGASGVGILFQGNFRGWNNVKLANCQVSNCGLATWANNYGADGIHFESWAIAPDATHSPNTNITVTGCKVWNVAGNGITFFCVDGGTVSGNECWANHTQGFESSNINAITISGNKFHDQIGGPSDGAGIDLGWGAQNCIVQDNQCWGNNGSGIQINQQGQPRLNRGHIIRRNILTFNGNGSPNGNQTEYGQFHVWGAASNIQFTGNVCIARPGTNKGKASCVRIHNGSQPNATQFVTNLNITGNTLITYGGVPLYDLTPQALAGAKGLVTTPNTQASY